MSCMCLAHPEPKLIIALGQFHNILFGKVVKQDAELRASYTYKLDLSTDGFYALKSCCVPELTGSNLFIRGAAAYADDRAFAHDYGTIDTATEARLAFTRLILALNGQVHGLDQKALLPYRLVS